MLLEHSTIVRPCSPSHGVNRGANQSRRAFARHGMTLAELLISMVILGLMSVVMAGMSHAVNSAWDYTKGIDSTEQYAAAVIDRLKYMVEQTGTYRVTGQPTRLGMAVIERVAGSTTVPDVLVLWTGGRNGGQATLGQQTRLPIASELLVYTWDEKSPSQLIEVAFSGDSTAIDFAAADFPNTIMTLLASPTAERITLCDSLRVSDLSATKTSQPTTLAGGSSWGTPVGNVRFTTNWSPTDAELKTTSAHTAAWLQLSWPQGAVGSSSGLRQATLNWELQLVPTGVSEANGEITAIPFFGSASVRYVYQP